MTYRLWCSLGAKKVPETVLKLAKMPAYSLHQKYILCQAGK